MPATRRFPLDQRLPGAARHAVLATIAPDQLINEQGLHRLDGHGVDDGDALVVATSGTTGSPRGVVLTHDAVAASARATSARLGVARDDIWLACLPLSHVGGLVGGDSSDRDCNAVGRARRFRRGRCRRCGTSRSDAGLAGANGVATRRRRLFRRIVLGGSRPPDDLPANVVTTYGMTETGSGVVYDGYPLDGVEIRVDSAGEIHLRCPMLMRCYRDGTIPLVDGWFATGDLGEVD